MKDKIYLICGSDSSIAASALLARLGDKVEFITTEQAAEMNMHSLRPEPIVFPIMAPPKFDIYFQPPLTRRERRQQKRKNKI